MVFRVHFWTQNQNIKLKKLKNENFENSSMSWSMPWYPDSLPNWPWRNEYILILKSSKKPVHGFSSSLFMQNWDIKVKKLKNDDFENSSMSWSMPWYPDSLPIWPWRNEYILILKSSKKPVHGFSSSFLDAKSEYQSQKAQKWKFWKFIYELEYALIRSIELHIVTDIKASCCLNILLFRRVVTTKQFMKQLMKLNH